jgi:hypothetical protein
MAETQDGEYYYDAGTINEQLDDYEVYEQDGRLYLNKEGADPQEAISFDGVAQVLQGPRAAPTVSELSADEHMIFVDEADGGVKAARLNTAEDDVEFATLGNTWAV